MLEAAGQWALKSGMRGPELTNHSPEKQFREVQSIQKINIIEIAKLIFTQIYVLELVSLRKMSKPSKTPESASPDPTP